MVGSFCDAGWPRDGKIVLLAVTITRTSRAAPPPSTPPCCGEVHGALRIPPSSCAPFRSG